MKIFCNNNIIKYTIQKQCSPSIEDINQTNDLAERLRGKNNEETLTNVLEWQDQNIEYWYERSDLFFAMYFAVIVLGILIYFSLNPYLPISKLIWLTAIPTALLLFLFFFTPYGNLVHLVFFSVGLTFEVLYTFFVLDINKPIIFLAYGLLLGIIFGNLGLTHFKYGHFSHKNTRDIEKKSASELVKLTFGLNMSVKEICECKFAICRDYAKLNSAFLIKSKIQHYFITAPSHVAAAIKINNEFYLLDQTLPLKRLDKWKSNYNKIYKVVFNEKYVKLELVDYECKENKSDDIVNISEIQADIIEIMHINQSDDAVDYTKISIENAAYYYDEVTHLSIVRLIKTRIEDEYCNNVSSISKIKIEQKNDDLIVYAYIN